MTPFALLAAEVAPHEMPAGSFSEMDFLILVTALAAYLGAVTLAVRQRLGDLRRESIKEAAHGSPLMDYIEHQMKKHRRSLFWITWPEMCIVISAALCVVGMMVPSLHSDVLMGIAKVLFLLGAGGLIILHATSWKHSIRGMSRRQKGRAARYDAVRSGTHLLIFADGITPTSRLHTEMRRSDQPDAPFELWIEEASDDGGNTPAVSHPYVACFPIDGTVTSITVDDAGGPHIVNVR